MDETKIAIIDPSNFSRPISALNYLVTQNKSLITDIVM